MIKGTATEVLRNSGHPLWFTAQNFLLSRQGQVTDRYTRAIEQLGSEKLDVRIGGIYALERVARDFPRDQPTVIAVLAAFVREHSHEQWPLPKSDRDPVPDHTTRPDVQAALTVSGRRNTRYDREPVNLNDANLVGADLARASLSRADLARADLTGAKLIRADLTNADLSYTNFTGALLAYADFTDAVLDHADLARADLSYANLTDAHLTNATLVAAGLVRTDLSGADLFGANLTSAALVGSDLTRADITRTDLTHADLTGARLSPDAVVPAGWQRDIDSGRLKKADSRSDDATAN